MQSQVRRTKNKECISLAKSGYEVYLLVNDDKGNEVKNNVHIISTNFAQKGRRQRMINSMRYLWREALKIDADVYHVHDPELMQLVGKMKRHGKKVVFDAHEDTQEQIMDKEWIPLILRRIVSALFGIYQKSVLRKCNAIVTVTPKLVKKLKTINNNVCMVTNYPILKDKTNAMIRNDDKKYVFLQEESVRNGVMKKLLRHW